MQLNAVNAAIATDPQGLIERENRAYFERIERAATAIADRFDGRYSVLLSGPSSSGKTTTAATLQQLLRERGRTAYTVSLDDFYLGRGKAPRLEDGSFDYESVQALDLPLLRACVGELMETGQTDLPSFDFHAGTPRKERTRLAIQDDSVVIFEGIHALHPLLEQQLSGERFKLYINVLSELKDGDTVLLTPREMRLTRRLLRDLRFRNSSLENTMDMWRQVVRGEDLYLFPYVDGADLAFDTTHAYEPAVLGEALLPLLREFPKTSPFYPAIDRVARGLSAVTPLSADRLPHECLLREFVG